MAYLTPYCHCSEPLKRNQYILGGIVPGLITGIFPMVYAIVTAKGWLLHASIFLTATACGDFLVLKRILKHPSSYTFLDHPKEIGFIVIKN